MDVSTQQIAELVGGRLVGDGMVLCQGANPPADAQPTDVTLLDEPKHVRSLAGCSAAAVVTTEEVAFDGHQIIVGDAHEAFTDVVSLFRPAVPDEVPAAGIHPSANVHPTATVHPSAVVNAGVKIGPRTQVMPGVVIMPRCQIGEDCVIHASVTLYEYTRLANRITIHAGSVLGANGFGYRQQNGCHLPTAQLGYVQVDDDVEIGAGVTIDRGTYGATRIGQGTKIDNQVMIAHNCRIGRHNLICSQVGVAGSSSTGDYVVMAGQVGLKDHIHLGDQTIVGAQSGVMDDCEGNAVLLGSPATNHRDQMQIMATQRKLPEMRRELKILRREITALRQIISDAGLEEFAKGKAA